MTRTDNKGAVDCPKCGTPIEELYRDTLVTAWYRDAMILLDEGEIVTRNNERQTIRLGQPKQLHETQWVCRVCGARIEQQRLDDAIMERKL